MKSKHLISLMAAMSAMTPLANAQDMRREADIFLSTMPAGLQARQENAVRKAMDGITAPLDSVRQSRNTASTLPEGVEAMDIDGIYRLYRPVSFQNKSLPVLVYLHGGGWCFGSINSCSRFCGELASKARICILAVDYPLAPEHPFPAALDCSLEALGFIKRNAEKYMFDMDAVSIGGDSAGGNLALATALQLAEKADMPELKSLLLFYPVTKAWNDGSDSWQAYGNGYGLDSGIMEAFNTAYIGDMNSQNPLISPFLASDEDLKRLPETLIINAGRDILCCQGYDMWKKLTDAGVQCRREVFDGAVHLFITVNGQETAFHRALKLSAEFLNPSSL